MRSVLPTAVISFFAAATCAAAAAAAAAAAEVTFDRIVIDPTFKAEACAAADVNRDGKLDVVAGENWYEAPDWRPHRFRPMDTNLGGSGYADVRLDEPVDVNRDGWVDIVSVRRDAQLGWWENTQGASGDWRWHHVGDSPLTEGVIFADVDGDGRGDFVGPTGQPGEGIAWWKAPQEPGSPWTRIDVGPKGADRHGLGVGDVNHDGRRDILTRWGWYEAPADPAQQAWTFHELDRGQSHHPVVYDFDGDGDPDIAASSPHDYGLWWWEQTQGDDGQARWKRHVIDERISQLHALPAADLDGDGDLDLLTGKRYHAHHGKDPGAEEPAMLVWYELARPDNKVTFTRHVIDENSGVGYTVTPVDIDADGDLDVLTANQKGVHLFVQKGSPTYLPLFNGRDLDNWIGDKTLWSVEDGAIVGRAATGLKHNDFLLSRDEYADFVLTLDVKLVPDSANSGIQFRSQPAEHGEVRGYQADVGRRWWGSIYEELGRGLLHDGYSERGVHAVIPNQWNHYVLYAVGDELRVEINGTVCTAIIDDKTARGIFAFQIHSGGPTDVRFRNIRLRSMN